MDAEVWVERDEGDTLRLCAAPAVSAQTAWLACTEPAHISAWFVHCEAGGDQRYRLHFPEDAGVHTKMAQVQRCEVDRLRVRLLWLDPGYPDSRLTVTVVRQDEAACVVILDHHLVPTALHEGYRTGWTGYLTDLVGWLKG